MEGVPVHQPIPWDWRREVRKRTSSVLAGRFGDFSSTWIFSWASLSLCWDLHNLHYFTDMFVQKRVWKLSIFNGRSETVSVYVQEYTKVNPISHFKFALPVRVAGAGFGAEFVVVLNKGEKVAPQFETNVGVGKRVDFQVKRKKIRIWIVSPSGKVLEDKHYFKQDKTAEEETWITKQLYSKQR